MAIRGSREYNVIKLIETNEEILGYIKNLVEQSSGHPQDCKELGQRFEQWLSSAIDNLDKITSEKNGNTNSTRYPFFLELLRDTLSEEICISILRHYHYILKD